MIGAQSENIEAVPPPDTRGSHPGLDDVAAFAAEATGGGPSTGPAPGDTHTGQRPSLNQTEGNVNLLTLGSAR